MFVWTFEGLSKLELEAIEAELVFQIRESTGKWPLSQNEIHFNNEYAESKVYAPALFSIMEEKAGRVPSNDTSLLFNMPPDQWGLRGDPFLWKALALSFRSSNSPKNRNEFERDLCYHFKRLTGKEPIAGETYYVEQFAFGGMSSGHISCDFWIDKGFPLLIDRFVNLFPGVQ